MDTVDSLISMILIFWSFAQFFVFCEIGENVILQFDNLSENIVYCEWYIFPHEIQRIFPIIVMTTRTPVAIGGFGNVQCTRNAFRIVG